MADLANLLMGGRPRTTDVDRVLALPVQYHDTDPEHFAGLALDGVTRLRAAQAEVLQAALHVRDLGPGPYGPRGVAALLGCGHGKTLVGQLLPWVFQAESPVLLLPASLVDQLRRDVEAWSPRLVLADPQVVTYEKLSSPDAEALLDRLRPDLLVLDEAHLLANPQSARWKRVERYLAANRHRCRVTVLSGTLTWASLRQMRHLLLASLRDLAPVPADASAEGWAAVLDLGSTPDGDAWAVTHPLLQWAARVNPSNAVGAGTASATKAAAREAFRLRLETCPGVVVTPGVSADVSLRMRRWVPPVERTLDHQLALRRLAELWELPDGTELVDALEHARHARTLALGFYLRWVPGTVDPDWLAARRAWAGAVRRMTTWGGYDSPALVERAARQGALPGRELALWREWAEEPRALAAPTWWSGSALKAYRDWPEPPTEEVWLDGGRYVERVVDCYLNALREPALVWVQSPALGEALEGAAGWRYHGEGSPPPPGDVHAVASMHVHGKGWNGQAYHHQLILEPPRGAAAWEQLLARTHRPGQTQDVHAWVLASDRALDGAVDAGLEGARYAQDTSGMPQRLLLADWEW